MTKNIFFIFSFCVAIVSFNACGDSYAKIAKKGSIEQKFEYAVKAYDKGQYSRALPLLEELITVYRGTANAEKVLYYYAYSNYYTGDYIMAGYEFKSFAKSFPTSQKAEECLYMSAYCYYLTSPIYSLDQTDTQTALHEFQTFINQYPNSTRITEANEIVGKLHHKLEVKAYEIAKQYYLTYNYKSAIVAMNNMIKDFPDSKFTEELHFLIVKSSYLLTINSIDSKRSERLKATFDAYLKFIDKYPQSEYLHEAEGIYSDSMKFKEKFNIQIT